MQTRNSQHVRVHSNEKIYLNNQQMTVQSGLQQTFNGHIPVSMPRYNFQYGNNLSIGQPHIQPRVSENYRKLSPSPHILKNSQAPQVFINYTNQNPLQNGQGPTQIHVKESSFVQRQRPQSHIQFLDDLPNQSTLTMNRHNSNQTGSFPYQQTNRSSPVQNRGSLQRRKRRLKIFPDSPIKERAKQIVNIVSADKQQIEHLKREIEHIKQHIKSYESQQNSRAQLRQSQPNGSKVIEFQRTKRIKQLNEQNQHLYNELVWKLRHVAEEQYQGYLEQANMSRSFLHELFQHSKHERRSGDKRMSGQKRRSSTSSRKFDRHFREARKDNYNVTDFIDNGAFEAEYERRYTQTRNTPEKPLGNIDTQMVANQTEEQQRKEPVSPFSIKQNRRGNSSFVYRDSPHQALNFPDSASFKRNRDQSNKNKGYQNSDERVNLNATVNPNKQAYTFNKGKPPTQMKSNWNRTTLKPFQEGQVLAKKDLKTALILETKRDSYATRKGSKVENKKKEINDLNRNLESKLMRKRVQSEYLKGKRIV